jgi:hypothetical protein
MKGTLEPVYSLLTSFELFDVLDADSVREGLAQVVNRAAGLDGGDDRHDRRGETGVDTPESVYFGILHSVDCGESALGVSCEVAVCVLGYSH